MASMRHHSSRLIHDAPGGCQDFEKGGASALSLDPDLGVIFSERAFASSMPSLPFEGKRTRTMSNFDFVQTI